MNRSGRRWRQAACYSARPRRTLHPCLCAFACLGTGSARATLSADWSTSGEPVGYLGNLHLALPALLCAGNEDDETIDLCDAVTPPADLGNGNVILLSDFNWLWLEGPESTAAWAAASIIPSSETRSFTS